ncbi:MAG: hypothetical protein ABI548_16810 [Polyangiaceae bacterium]
MAPTCVEFCRSLGLDLTPGQAALVGASFDGAPVPPEFADLFGGQLGQPRHASAIVWLCGRASGKTLMAAAALLHRGLTADLSGMRPGEVAYGIIVAPDMKLASLTLANICGWLDSTELAALVVSRNADSVTLKRPDGRVICIAVFAASRGGSAVRGKTIFAAVLDESCFFRAADSAVINDGDVYRALVPRLLPGGWILFASTPWLRAGLTWDLYEANYGKATASALVAKAPTARMRTDSPSLLASIEAERRRDPINAGREFDADWLPQGSGSAFDLESLKRSIVEQTTLTSGQFHAGGDWGLIADMSSVCIAREGPNNLIIVCDVLEMRPKKGQPLSLTNVLKQSSAFVATYHLDEINVDRHILEPARDTLLRERISLRLNAVSESAADRELRYTGAIQAFKDGRVQIPRRFAALTDQLARIVSAPRPGGGHKFSVGRADGNHADTAMAFLLAAEPIVRRINGNSFYNELGRMAASGELGASFGAQAAARVSGRGVDVLEKHPLAHLMNANPDGGWLPWKP